MRTFAQVVGKAICLVVVGACYTFGALTVAHIWGVL